MQVTAELRVPVDTLKTPGKDAISTNCVTIEVKPSTSRHTQGISTYTPKQAS